MREDARHCNAGEVPNRDRPAWWGTPRRHSRPGAAHAAHSAATSVLWLSARPEAAGANAGTGALPARQGLRRAATPPTLAQPTRGQPGMAAAEGLPPPFYPRGAEGLRAARAGPTHPLCPPPPTASGTAPPSAAPPAPAPAWPARIQRPPARPAPPRTAPRRTSPARRRGRPGERGTVTPPPPRGPGRWRRAQPGSVAPWRRRRWRRWRHWARAVPRRGAAEAAAGGRRAWPSRSRPGHLGRGTE